MKVSSFLRFGLFGISTILFNGTFKIDVPQADLILISLDGGKEKHNYIRGETYDNIISNVRNATASNICFYMAIAEYLDLQRRKTVFII